MSNQISLNWGITDDLEAQVRYEPNACKGYVIDISLGCPHRCIYCLFSPLELLVYKLKNPGYRNAILPLKLNKFLKTNQFPPAVYMCYASDPLGNDEITENSFIMLEKFLHHDVHVFFISKGIFSEKILKLIARYPHLLHIQVGIANCDDKRNKIIEPGAPGYDQRIDNLRKLSKIEGLSNLSVRIDPLLPVIDDERKNVEKIINDVAALGVKEAVIGYLIVTKDMRERLKRNSFTCEAGNKLTEKTITISKQELYSIPTEEKLANLNEFNELCTSKGMYMSVCGCKDEKLKKSNLEWICHPFNRSKREQLFHGSEDSQSYNVEVSHLT